MSSYIPIILISALVAFIVTPVLRRFAQRANFVANPKADRIHATPTPMLGGIAIYLGVVIAVALTGNESFIELLGVLGGATVMVLFGLWDDRIELSPLLKMLGQIIAGAILILSGIQVNIFDWQVLNIAVTLFWIIGISNAINFQDNMDGLAAGLSTVASGFFFILALVEQLSLVSILAAAVLGASIGFLYYNFNPASLFMGDAGSLLLGFMLAVLGIKLEFATTPLGATWMIPIIILGVPIFDTTLVVVSRIRRGIHVYQGGKDHTSHRLVSSLGMTHARSVMTLYMAATALGLTAIMLRDATVQQARLLVAGLSIVFVGALIWLEIRFRDQVAPPPQNRPHQ